MTATLALTTALQRHVLVLEEDLRTRVESSAEVAGRWHAEHNEALARRRTAATWQAWRDDRVTQAARTTRSWTRSGSPARRRAARRL